MSEQLTPQELTQVRRLLGDPLNFPLEFKQWLTSWLGEYPPPFTISQILGFSSFSNKSVTAIYDTTLPASAATVDVQNIASSAHLFMVVDARGDTASGDTPMNLRLNNDSGANYDRQMVQGAAATAAASESFANTSIGVHSGMAAATAGASLTSQAVLWIPAYAGVTFNKIVHTLGAEKTGTASGSLVIRYTAGFWRSSAAVTRITLTPGAGNFVTGSRFTLYTMGA